VALHARRHLRRSHGPATPRRRRRWRRARTLDCPEAALLPAAGLYIVIPSTPYDAKGLLKSAVRDDNPVAFFEHKGMYNLKGEVPEEEYTIHWVWRT